ncbi:hypothetical protein B296_00005244 [Ensete ventricosum]|uniref:Uncharacterized protein n=1 Tax=Ensete ventricosum TaxID=4639 RepID=A0A427ARP1_ENSVE|nr:hypothetical protein B296_00005244 [Ensete ventricosum]
MVYVLCVYNKKEKNQRMMQNILTHSCTPQMAAYNIQDALNWKQKIESVIDQGYEFLKNFQEPIALYVVTACLEISDDHSRIHLRSAEESESSKKSPFHSLRSGVYTCLLEINRTRFLNLNGVLCYDVVRPRMVVHASAGLCGLVTFVMYVIGGVMMMEVMVSIKFKKLAFAYHLTQHSWCHASCNAVVLFQSREHPDCGPQPGFVRAHLESMCILSFR